MENETWNERIVRVIKELGRPATRKELEDIISENFQIPHGLGPHLSTAKKAGIIKRIKIHPSRKGHYCNPDWVDENGKLKPEHDYNPFWK